jgi:hypothetical protein
LKYTLAELISEPQLGHAENDDCGSFIETDVATYAWVIDGATSLAERSYLGASLGDVAWYSEALSHALRSHARSGASPAAVHALAVADVAAAYEKDMGSRLEQIPLYARPAAAVTLMRLDGRQGQLFYLADCPAFMLSNTERVTRLTDMHRSDGEQELRERVRSTQSAKDLTPKQMFREHLEWLRAARQEQLENPPLQVSAAISGATFGGWERALDLSDVRALILMSDGFERYSAQYGLGDDADMVRAVMRDGAEGVLKQIRALEQADAACQRIPRLKVSDDATCLVVTREN